MRSLVTGGGGFIGHHLARSLVEAGDTVRVLDNFATGRRERLADVDVELVEGDLRSYERVHSAVRGVERVFHLGALPSVPRSIQDPLTTHAVNVDGTLNVVLAARDEGVGHVVIASSSSIYGANPAVPKDEQHLPVPVSPYAVSKLAAERYCRAFWEVYGLPTTSLRLFNVYGPGQSPDSEYAAVVPKFLARLSVGEPPTIYGDGSQTRDFTYVADVVRAFVAATETPDVAGETFNVAGGSQTSILELASKLSALMHVAARPVHAPQRDGEVRLSQGDASHAAARLGWTPQWTLDEGLGACVDAFPTSAAVSG
ncbi:MAG: NAD-dependent epimerase/dehydratase family protein [Miltoncostaeaceae bacterium]